MGREIRRVPPNWEHPTQACPHRPTCEGGRCFQPLYDEDYDEVANEWLKDCINWSNGIGPDYSDADDHVTDPYYWDYAGPPPDREHYRPRWTQDPTYFQVYENVSEGTPVTPALATQEELIEYLVQHGDYWDQRRGDTGWNRTAAEQFVKDEYCPSMVVISNESGVRIETPGHTLCG